MSAKPLSGPVGKQRIKFGKRKDGTKWFWPMTPRYVRFEEIRDINNTLRVVYGTMQQMQEQGDSKDQ